METKTKITLEINRNDLGGYTNEFLQAAWHIAQANPAPYGDRDAGELVELIGREIILRWLKQQTPELWSHQGRGYFQSEMMKHGDWSNGDYRPHAAVFAENVARDIRSIAGMDPADSRIPKMLKAIQCEAEKLVGPISS